MAPVQTIDTDALRLAQLAWHEAEMGARAAYTDIRLDRLGELADGLTWADQFDAAYAIWDDYIDGRREDERMLMPEAPELNEQAYIFARVAPYLTPAEVVALARAAWGGRTFEVFLAESFSTLAVVGKVCWYPQSGSLSIVRAAAAHGDHFHLGASVLYTASGATVSFTARTTVALHPVFGVRS